MGSRIYYVKAQDESGSKIILRLTFHHGDIEDVQDMTEEEAQKEIKANTD